MTPVLYTGCCATHKVLREDGDRHKTSFLDQNCRRGRRREQKKQPGQTLESNTPGYVMNEYLCE